MGFDGTPITQELDIRIQGEDFKFHFVQCGWSYTDLVISSKKGYYYERLKGTIRFRSEVEGVTEDRLLKIAEDQVERFIFGLESKGVTWDEHVKEVGEGRLVCLTVGWLAGLTFITLVGLLLKFGGQA